MQGVLFSFAVIDRAAPLSSFEEAGSVAFARGEGVSPLRHEAILASPDPGAMHIGSEVQGQDALATRNKGRMPSPRVHGQTSLVVPPVWRGAKEGRILGQGLKERSRRFPVLV
jgi:hypothetical protein